MKIVIESEGKTGTGFFMKCKIKNPNFKFLITCNHVISEKEINSKKTISIYYGKLGQEIKERIKLDKNDRFIKTYVKNVDVTVIQIIEKDYISDNKFLYPDLNYKNGFYFYINKNFYLAGYPSGYNGQRAICSGKIKEIKNFEFSHTLDTRAGSSGSPICLIENNCVIGIHKSGDKLDGINFGTFIGFILDDLEKENIEKKYEKCGHTQLMRQMTKSDLNKLKEIGYFLNKIGLSLGKAEIYAIRFGKGELKKGSFNYYTTQNDKLASKSILFNSLKESINLIKNEFREFRLKYGEIEYPADLSKEQLLGFINEWKSCVSPEDKKIYDDLLSEFQ